MRKFIEGILLLSIWGVTHGCSEKKNVFEDVVAIYCYPKENKSYPLDFEYVDGQWAARYQGVTPIESPILLEFTDSFDNVISFKEQIDGGGIYNFLKEDGKVYSIEYVNGSKTVQFDVLARLTKEATQVDVENIRKVEHAISTDGATTHFGTELWPLSLQKITYLLHHNPHTLQYDFENISASEISHVTSDDGNLRLYYGTYYNGGNGHGSTSSYLSCQYAYNNHVVVIDNLISAMMNDGVDTEYLSQMNFGYINGVNVYDANLSGNHYYLVELSMCDEMPMPYYSENKKSGCVVQSRLLMALNIEKGKLYTEPIFNDNYFIEIPYGDTNYFDTPLFDYDDAAKELSIAIVDTNLEETGSFIIYKWDEKQFKYIGKR